MAEVCPRSSSEIVPERQYLNQKPVEPGVHRGHPPAFRFNQFGWNLNGLVFIPHMLNESKQKLFFLAGQEYLRYRSQDTQTGIVPTALMRQGNFSELLGWNIFYQKPVQLVNPVTGLPYPNNIITSGLSLNGIGLLNAYPLPNQTAPNYNWELSAAHPQNQRKDTLVLDYIPFEAHRIQLSLVSYNCNQIVPFSSNFTQLPQVCGLAQPGGIVYYTWTINSKKSTTPPSPPPRTITRFPTIYPAGNMTARSTASTTLTCLPRLINGFR